jgi:hypothetical protein
MQGGGMSGLRRRGVALFVLCAMVQLCAPACAFTTPADSVAAVGWAGDGRLLVATTTAGGPVKLWVARPGGGRRELMRISYCPAILVFSLHPLPSGRLGLVLECLRPIRRELVAVDLATGRVQRLASSRWIGTGVWLESVDRGFVEYLDGPCAGVGEVDRTGAIRPLALTVTLPTGAVPLASALPPPGGAGCPAPRAVTRQAVASPDGRRLGFFLRLCPANCTQLPEPGEAWYVVVEDRGTGRVRVAGRRFESPTGLALADDGALAVVGRDDGRSGLWYCHTLACAQPRRLTDDTPGELSFRADGTRLAGITDLSPRLYDVA